jgi:hypothetical protein
MRHRKQQNPDRADLASLARYAHDLTRARLLLDAQIRRGDVAAVHVRSWLFGADALDTAEAAA